MFKTFGKYFKEGVMFFGERTSALVNALLLGTVYIVGVGPMSLLARLSRKKFLDLTIDTARASYWEEAEKQPDTPNRYYRQF